MAESGRKRKLSNLFTPDLPAIMYAYGDVAFPSASSVDTLQDILEEYLTDICHETYRIARSGKRAKIKIDDIKFALRNDPRVLGRVEELLVLQKSISDARKQYDTSEGKLKSEMEKAEKQEKTEKPTKEKSKSANNNPDQKPRKVGRPRKQKD